MELGERIAAWRKWKGWTVPRLAEAVGVTAAAAYQWEGTGKAKTSPAQPTLEKIVAALGLTMERFYGRLPKAKAAS